MTLAIGTKVFMLWVAGLSGSSTAGLARRENGVATTTRTDSSRADKMNETSRG